jgi:CHAT domain-containing protein
MSLFGPDHPNVAVRPNNLGAILQKTSRVSEAEPLAREALRIDESSFGAAHPTVGIDLQNLASLIEDKGQWAEAAAIYARAKPIMTGESVRSRSGGELRKVALAQNKAGFMDYARVLYHDRADNPANRAEAFELAQWALQNEAAAALSSMAARFAGGNQRLGQLVREQQDLVAARHAAYHSLDAAAAKADTKAAETARAAVRQTEAKLKDKGLELRKTFSVYAECVSPNPLPLADAQALLGSKALVLFLDMPRWAKLPEETLIFAVTANEVRWVKLAIGMGAIRAGVKALRCGLDDTNWEPGGESVGTCAKFLKTERSPLDETPPFDAALANIMYRRLLGGIEDLIKDRELLIVPSGALTQLPFEVLVTQKPDEAVARYEAYKTATWLGQRQAITILPSVGSLRALQAAKTSEGGRPHLGIGNPLLDGLDGNDKRAWAKQTCARSSPTKEQRNGRQASRVRAPFRAGAVDVDDLRHQGPLPESADELCDVAKVLGVPDARLDKSVYLGSRATVRQVKTLSRTGELAAARVVHFATHGLLAGETAWFAKNKPEPALLLTPPAANEASDEDNGLLNASEVAQLKLNADWVILSACNTAAGGGDDAEALSGLARAFFYAGARSLLVSHWKVDADAAVAITAHAVNAMKAEPGIGRAEALWRGEAALIARGGRFAHPSIWAPFVLVGNGGD